MNCPRQKTLETTRGACRASGVACLLSVALFAAPLAARAFDSGAWLDKRAALDGEADRLRRAYAACAAHIVSPAENVTLPVESHPDGSVKASVSAKAAQFFIDEGLVWGTNVVVRQFATNGVVEAEVEADCCVVDRNAKAGWVEGRVRARYLTTELEGERIYLSFSEEFVRISTNTVIRARDLKFKTAGFTGGRMRLTNGVEVVSTRADYDRGEGVLLFDGAVRATDGEYAFGADRVFVFLDGTNELRRVVADGNVTVENGPRSGSCPRATYVRPLGQVVMYGDGPDRPARLKEEAERRNELEGRKITFWLDSEQVEVEGATFTVDGGMAGGKEGFLERLTE